ncbi:MAG: hypothetical protein V3U24_01350 [Candidatus Neomarinimicrobiota bacterium]
MILEFSRTWLPYIYLYGVGGIFFLVGLWIILRYRSLNLQLKRDRSWFRVLLFGFVWYAMIHAVVIWAALRS